MASNQSHQSHSPHAFLFHSKISDTLDQGQLTIGVFLDLTKAFDTVSYEHLIDKLHHYGIRGSCLCMRYYVLHISYLNSWSQLVSCINFSFSSAPVHFVTVFCVRSSSILLFLVYIGNSWNYSESLEFPLFATMRTHLNLAVTSYVCMSRATWKCSGLVRCKLSVTRCKQKMVYMTFRNSRKIYILPTRPVRADDILSNNFYQITFNFLSYSH